jgi:hypothetical protein
MSVLVETLHEFPGAHGDCMFRGVRVGLTRPATGIQP